MHQRKIWLDYARVFAIISISCNHAINRAFFGFDSAYEAFRANPLIGGAFRAVVFIFSRLGVPFFLMITGSLLLNKKINGKEDIIHFYRHNLGRLFITCEIWLFIGFWITAISSEPEILQQGVFYIALRCLGSLLFINQVAQANMWYIPMILCLYLLIPYVNILVNKYGSKLMLIPCGLLFLGAMVIPNINSACALVGSDFKLNFELSPDYLFSYYLLYVLAGYCISKDCFKKLPTAALLFLSLLTFALSCAYQGWEYTIPGADKTYYNFAPMALSAVFLFACFHRFSEKMKERRYITYLSKISFAIFLIHLYVMKIMLRLPVLPKEGTYPVVRFLLLETVSVGGSIAAIYVLSRIPLLKKYLFMIKD